MENETDDTNETFTTHQKKQQQRHGREEKKTLGR